MAPGVIGASINAVQTALLKAGAVPVVIAARLGAVKTADGKALDATASFENAASVLFDAVVLPDGAAAVSTLAGAGPAQEFVAHQYRHGKTVLALGASRALLEKAGIAVTLPSGAKDGGIVLSDGKNPAAAASAFIKAVGQHRHPERETDRPKV